MNKNFLIKYLCLIMLMTFTCFISYKVIAKVIDDGDDIEDNYSVTNIDKSSKKVIINFDNNYELKKYYDENNLDKKLVNFSNCLHSYMSINSIDDEIKKEIEELENYYNMDNSNFSFYYQDINTGFSVSYNASQPIFGASVLKAPFIIYIYKLASEGKINLDEELEYTANYIRGGTGIMKDQKVGGKYSIRDLCYNSIVYSDNVAYSMLADKYKINNSKSFWNKLNVNSIYLNDDLFSDITADDMGIILQYLYDFSLENDIFGKELMSYFTSSITNLIPKYDRVIAHKSGWSGTAIHDASIVFDDNPYILIIFSLRGEIEYDSLFKFTSDKINLIHNNFWNSNVNYCINEFKK